MTPREELDLILKLIRKYNLPLSPILEYAVNEKKDEYPEKGENGFVSYLQKETIVTSSLSVPESILEEPATIELTREIIEAARTPNGGFTKSQLAALGIEWPAPPDWMAEKIGLKITKSQLEQFNRIEYISNKITLPKSKKGEKTYRDVANDARDKAKMEAVLVAISHFDLPATPRDIARTVSRSAWGGSVNEDSVDTILKRMPEVEYIKWGKYILKSKLDEQD